MIEYCDFVKIIISKRLEMGLTKAHMAKEMGINKQRYYRIEAGKCEPTFIELQIMCRELNINLDDYIKINEALPKLEPHFD